MNLASATTMPRDPGPPLRSVTRWSAGFLAAGALLCGFAAAGDPRRFAFAYLWAFALAWIVVVGSLFFVVLQHLTRSLWSVVIRRVAEVIASCAGVLVLLAVPVLLFAWFNDTFHLFPWLDAHHVTGDPVLEGKAPYLNLEFMTMRLAIFFLLWWGFARFYVGRSVAQDHAADGTLMALSMRRWAPVFMLVFAGSVTFTSFDLLMSLNPHWFSTIFGVYVWSGMFGAALAAITLAVLWLRSCGRLGDGLIRGDHLYSLGALMFAMSCFWAYIAFSQFLLIWYGNLPEETVFFAKRFAGGWAAVTVILAVARFGLPFLVMMSRPAKASPRVLIPMAAVILAGEALDLYWLIMPEAGDGGPSIGWPEAGPLLLVTGALGLAFASFLGRHPAVAAGDPLLVRSSAFHL